MDRRVLIPQETACCCGGGGGPSPSGCVCPDLSADWTKQRITLKINSYTITIAPPSEPVLVVESPGEICFPMVRNGCNLFLASNILPCAFTGSGYLDTVAASVFNPFNYGPFWLPGTDRKVMWQSCIRHPFGAYDFVAMLQVVAGGNYFTQVPLVISSSDCGGLENAILGTHILSGSTFNGSYNVNLTLDYQEELNCGVSITGYPFGVSPLLATAIGVQNPSAPVTDNQRYFVVMEHTGGGVWVSNRSVLDADGNPANVTTTFTLTDDENGHIISEVTSGPYNGQVVVERDTEPLNLSPFWLNNNFQMLHRPPVPTFVDSIFEI